MKKLSLAVIAALGLTAMPALAQSWYLGAGIGRGNLDVSGSDLGLPNASVGDNATTYTARLGWQLNPYFALEVGYYDHGEYDFSSDVGAVAVRGTAKAKSYGFSAVGILPLSPQFDLYGRLGYANSELKVNASAGGFVANGKEDEWGLLYGVGGRWNAARNWGVFAEWGRNDEIQVDSYTVGIDFRF